MNDTRLERTYANNRLKRFKTRNMKDLSTRQAETRKMINIASENSADAMKKSNVVNRNVRIIDEPRSEAARNIDEDSSADDQVVEDITADDNLLNSKTRNIHAIDKLNARRSNRLTEIENSLNKIDRRKNTAAFPAIDEVSIEKK